MDELNPVGGFAGIILGFYITLSSILVVNFITGFLIRVTNEVASQLQDVRLIEEQSERDLVFKELQDLFHEMDIDGSQSLSIDEYHLALQNPRIVDVMSHLKLALNDMPQLIYLLDPDNTGEVEIDTFIVECLRLRGGARSTDIWHLQMQAKELTSMVKSVMRMLEGVVSIEGVQEHAGLLRKSPGMSLVTPGSSRNRLERSFCDSFASTKALDSPHPQVPDKELMLTLLRDRMWTGSAIPRVEMRAMTLKELQGVCTWIRSQCPVEHWQDPITGSYLRPQDINLYHFNHYAICPSSVPDGVLLGGLNDHSEFREGQKVIQRCPGDRMEMPVAEGIVKKSGKGWLEVGVTCGRFECSPLPHAGPVEVDGISCGVPGDMDVLKSFSFKELVSSTPIQPMWYVSHYWGHLIIDFVACCVEHAKRWALSDDVASYWVCGYANRQYTLSEEIGDSLENSAFRRAMKLAKGTLLVLDEEAKPFDRIWCDYELCKTLLDSKVLLDIVTSVDIGNGKREPVLLSEGSHPHESAHAKSLREQRFPIQIIVKGMKAKLQDGRCTVQSDKIKILRELRTDVSRKLTTKSFHDPVSAQQSDEDAFRPINNALHASLALRVWPQAVKQNAVLNLDADADLGLKISLPDVLQRDTQRTTLSLSLAHSEELNDRDLADLAFGLPTSLLNLQLNFKRCRNITDCGVEVLAEALPLGLNCLQLNCEGCDKITDAGLICLAGRIASLSSLQQLRLDFAHCSDIGVPGFRALADAVPRHVKDFTAVLLGTGLNVNIRSAKDLKNLRKNGRQLGRLQKISSLIRVDSIISNRPSI